MPQLITERIKKLRQEIAELSEKNRKYSLDPKYGSAQVGVRPTGQRAKARLSINVWIAHAGAFGNQYLSELVLFVQYGSQFRQDRTQLVRVFSCNGLSA
jgi:hypothetical protein